MAEDKYFGAVPTTGDSRIPAQMVNVKLESSNEVTTLPEALNSLYSDASESEESIQASISELNEAVQTNSTNIQSNSDKISTLEEEVKNIDTNIYWTPVN